LEKANFELTKQKSADMPITVEEYNTFHFTTELTLTLFPSHRVYVTQVKNVDNNTFGYRAGVAKYEDEMMGDTPIDSGTQDTRIEALEKLLVDLEDVAQERLSEELDAEARKRAADSKDETKPSEKEDTHGKRKAPIMKGVVLRRRPG
jgi:hypothetical protein